MTESKLRDKIYRALNRTASFHFSEVDGEINDKYFPINSVLETLNYFLDGTCLLSGDYGWGKTTSAKITSSALSGLPYDLFDSTEIRGHPHLYEEKTTGRFDFHKLQKEGESVIWRSSFLMPCLVIDEANWIPYESQATLLQGIETGRWMYQDHLLYEGKKPTFLTINKKEDENGLLKSLEDRIDIGLHYEPFSPVDMTFLREAKENLVKKLYNPKATESFASLLSDSREKLKGLLGTITPMEGSFSEEERKEIKKLCTNIPFDSDASLFLQSFTAEMNFNQRYGKKRAEDLTSDDTHDQKHIGIYFKSTLSPRTWMATENFASALAWFLQDKKVTKDHVKFVLPYTIHHKLKPTTDFSNERAGDVRKKCFSLHLANYAVKKAEENYINTIQKSKSLIARLQSGKVKQKEIDSLNPDDFDHPLMRQIVIKLKEPRTFYSKQ